MTWGNAASWAHPVACWRARHPLAVECWRVPCRSGAATAPREEADGRGGGGTAAGVCGWFL